MSLPPAAPSADALAALMARVALADRAALRALYQATAARLLGVILRIQTDRAVAEELLQEVFIKVWSAAAGYDPQRAQVMTWLHSVARHAAIDSLRRQRSEPAVARMPAPSGRDEDDDPLAHVPAQTPGPAELLSQALQARLVRHCMGGLQRDQRQSLALAFYDGLSHAELAQHLGQPLGTVKSWLRRGLQALQQCLARAGLADAAQP